MGVPQRVPVPIVGGSAGIQHDAQQSERTVNMVVVTSDGAAKSTYALKALPGSFRWADLTLIITGNPQIRGMHMMAGRLFAVVAEKIAEVVYDATLNAFSTLTEYATLSTFSGRVCISDNSNKLVIGDGTGFYVLDLDTRALTQVLNEDTDIIRGTFSEYIDGYTLYFQRDSGRYYYSELNDPTTVRGLNYMTAEGSPDNTVAALVVNREVIIFGTDSIEFHFNSGGADNAFERISGGYISHGCAARWSVRKFDNSAVFLGRNEDGQGVVWRLGAAGAAPTRISNAHVERHIQKVLFAAIERRDLTEQITSLSYQNADGYFYHLNLPAVPATNNSPAQPSMTWVYNAAVPPALAWTEAGFMNPATGLHERALADHHVVYRGRDYTGAYDHAHIYELSDHYYRENTVPLVKWRETGGPMSFEGRGFALNRLEIMGNHGAGRDGGGPGSDPQVMVQFCWDGVWSDPVPRPWGKIGERNAKAVWDRCGWGHDLIIRVICSEPIAFTITNAWADVTVGR